MFTAQNVELFARKCVLMGGTKCGMILGWSTTYDSFLKWM